MMSVVCLSPEVAQRTAGLVSVWLVSVGRLTEAGAVSVVSPSLSVIPVPGDFAPAVALE